MPRSQSSVLALFLSVTRFSFPPIYMHLCQIRQCKLRMNETTMLYCDAQWSDRVNKSKLNELVELHYKFFSAKQMNKQEAAPQLSFTTAYSSVDCWLGAWENLNQSSMHTTTACVRGWLLCTNIMADHSPRTVCMLQIASSIIIDLIIPYVMYVGPTCMQVVACMHKKE